MRTMGVDLVERTFLPIDSKVESIAWEVGLIVKLLAQTGADMTHLAVTVGQHPSFPGSLTIEGKAKRRAGLPAEIAVPPADEADLAAHFRKTLGIEDDDPFEVDR